MENLDAQRNSEAFLARFGLRLGDIDEEIPSLNANNDLVLLVGSIPDGVATHLSDVDLLVVRNCEPREHLHAGDFTVVREGVETLVYRLPCGLEMNVSFYEDTSVLPIAEKMARIVSEGGERKSTSEAVNYRTLKFLHQIKTGFALRGDPSRLRQRLFLDLLPEVAAANARMEYLPLREDVVGEVVAGRETSALHVLSLMMNKAVWAMLASNDVTNPDPKWQYALIEKHRATIGQEIADMICAFLVDRAQGDAIRRIECGFDIADSLMADCLRKRPLLAPVFAQLDQLVRHETDLPSANKPTGG